MSSRGVRLGMILVALLGLLVPAGCGVPGKGRPIVVGEAPKLGGHSEVNPDPPPGPAGASTPVDLVKRYLQAAAWGDASANRPNGFPDAVDKVRSFLTEEYKQWTPPGNAGITIVRVINWGEAVPVTGGVVRVTLQPVGVLVDHGKVQPMAQPAQVVEFPVVPASVGSGLRIARAPKGLMLSDEALRDWYEVHPIYFWNTGDQVLVPDLRYLAKSVPEAKRPDEVLIWILAGPSIWLRGAVRPIPQGVEVREHAYFEGSTLVVNLPATAAGLKAQELSHFVDQLRWSLRPFAGPVQLRIEGQPWPDEGPPDRYLDANPAGPPKPSTEPEAFVVVDGQVQPVRSTSDRVQALITDQNFGVVAAAISRNKQSGALVRVEAGGRRRLWLGRYDTAVSGARYTATELVAAAMSRPVWLSAATLRVLVAADGRLWDVSPGGAHPVEMPSIGSVTAFAIAPDGRRIALVAGGRAYLAPLLVDAIPDRVAIGAAHEVVTGLAAVGGVAFSREDWIVVAGRNGEGHSALVEVTVDGALVEPLNLADLAGLNVTAIVGYPQSPTNEITGFILLEAGDQVWKVFSRNVGRQLPGGGPSPSGRPGSSPAKVTSPFYLE
jgi:hypothetical protein